MNVTERDFRVIEQALGLYRLGAVAVGVLYRGSGAPEGYPVVVRRFEGAEPRTVCLYARLVESVGRWIADREEIARWVEIEPALEVGRDFFARRDEPYLPSLYAIECDDEPREPPHEFREMRAAVARRLREGGTASVVERVIARSLMEPATGTFFLDRDEGESTFLLLDPAILDEDLVAFENEE